MTQVVVQRQETTLLHLVTQTAFGHPLELPFRLGMFAPRFGQDVKITQPLNNMPFVNFGLGASRLTLVVQLIPELGFGLSHPLFQTRIQPLRCPRFDLRQDPLGFLQQRHQGCWVFHPQLLEIGFQLRAGTGRCVVGMGIAVGQRPDD